MPDIPPPPKRGESFRPFITHQRSDGKAGVLVRWSLPGLAEATLRVPAQSWIEGEHLRAGDALAAFVTPVQQLPDGDDDAQGDTAGEPPDEYAGDY